MGGERGSRGEGGTEGEGGRQGECVQCNEEVNRMQPDKTMSRLREPEGDFKTSYQLANHMPENRSKDDIFKELTWSDLRQWAGDKILERGKNYHLRKRVQKLARTPGGGIVAWVNGTKQYATIVDMEDEELVSECDCPYWDTCKHAVAVILEFLKCMKAEDEIPLVREKDRRLRLLHKTDNEEEFVNKEVCDHDHDDKEICDDDHNDEWSGDSDDEWGDDEEYEDKNDHGSEDEDDKLGCNDDDELDVQDSLHMENNTADNMFRTYLESLAKQTLIGILERLSRQFPDVRKELEARRVMSGEPAGKLVDFLEREIEELSSEQAWYNPWKGEGNIPDYSKVRNGLERLLASGHADEVLHLGELLLEAGTNQVEMSDDEGEVATEIAECMEIVFRALPRSSLTQAEQMIWATKVELDDDYGICEEVESFWELEHDADAWNILAMELNRKLEGFDHLLEEDSFSGKYHRDNITNRLINALGNAGREDEIIPLCEREAEITGSYVRLVDRLLEVERWDDAEKWILRGIEVVDEKQPGTGSELRKKMREVRERIGDLVFVTALRADDFFLDPTHENFNKLKKAAEKADVWGAVESWIMEFLDTGVIPLAGKSTGKGELKDRSEDGSKQPWPLPETGLRRSVERNRNVFPVSETLIYIAMDEKNLEEVIRWYDHRTSEGKKQGWHYNDERIKMDVARVLASESPQVSISIWKKLAEKEIAATKVKSYGVAASYLEKAREILENQNKKEEWESYLAELRRVNKRKRRLMEILDEMEGSSNRIIDDL